MQNDLNLSIIHQNTKVMDYQARKYINIYTIFINSLIFVYASCTPG